MLTFKEYVAESYFFPSTVKNKKSVDAKSNEMTFNHSSKDNESVHNHLTSLGFKQNGASDVMGPQVHTEYQNKNTGMKAYHIKGKSQSSLTIKKQGS
jgi:hypothetical protein